MRYKQLSSCVKVDTWTAITRMFSVNSIMSSTTSKTGFAVRGILLGVEELISNCSTFCFLILHPKSPLLPLLFNRLFEYGDLAELKALLVLLQLATIN